MSATMHPSHPHLQVHCHLITVTRSICWTPPQAAAWYTLPMLQGVHAKVAVQRHAWVLGATMRMMMSRWMRRRGDWWSGILKPWGWQGKSVDVVRMGTIVTTLILKTSRYMVVCCGGVINTQRWHTFTNCIHHQGIAGAREAWRSTKDAASVRYAATQASRGRMSAGGATSATHRSSRSISASSTLGGARFKAKKAGGDVKGKSKVEPFAYWKMDRKMLNKRAHKRTSASKGLSSVVGGARAGAAKGAKAKRQKR